MTTDVDRSHHQAVQSQRKGFNLDDVESTLRNNILESNEREENCQPSVIGLLGNSMKALWISKENMKRQRNRFYLKRVDKTNERIEDRTLQDNSLSSASQWIDEESKQRNKEILMKIYIPPSGRLAGTAFNTGVYIQHSEKKEKNVHILSNCLQRNTDSHSKEKDGENPDYEETTEEYRVDHISTSRIRIQKR